ncbi:MAG: HipA domain-containing protein [Parvularculales bacterium]
MESGSDRIGGLDFQLSPVQYTPRRAGRVELDELLGAAALIEKGLPLPADLAAVIHYGTAIGGARPKALIDGDGVKSIAKFSLSTDQYNVIGAEFAAMRLAGICGLNVARVKIAKASGKDVLLIERFDRRVGDAAGDEGWTRRLLLSALTLLQLDEMTARYASYEDLADIIRRRFTEPKATLHELFGRIVFNILCGNTDDHARNHAAFWDGQKLTRTPAYDICPQMRLGGEASQAMLIDGSDRRSRLASCVAVAKNFMLGEAEAREVIDGQLAAIRENRDTVFDEAGLAPVDRDLLNQHVFLSDYAFEGYGDQGSP